MRQARILLLLIAGLVSTGHAQSMLSGPTANTIAGTSVMAFDLVAAKNLEINDFSLDFTPSFFSSIDVSVYRMRGFGSHVGGLGDPHAWEAIVERQSVAWTSGNLALSLGISDLVPAGETQAYMIVVNPGNTLAIRTGLPVGSTAASNADLSLLSGTVSADPGYLLNAIYPDFAFTGLVHYTVKPALGDDLLLEAILTPIADWNDCSKLSQTEPVTVQIRNLGTNPLPSFSLIQFDLHLNGQLVVSDQVLTMAALAPGATLTHLFSIAPDLSTGPSHVLMATAGFAGDQDGSNDSLTRAVLGGGLGRVTTLPWSEDFDYLAPLGTTGGQLDTPRAVPTITPPPGWYQDPGDSSGIHAQWTFGTGDAVNAWATTYPSYSTSPAGSPYFVRMLSPCIDLGQALNPRLRYGYFNRFFSPGFPVSVSPMSVDVIRQSTGQIDIDVDGPTYEWLAEDASTYLMRRRSVDLSPYIGDVIRLVFRAELLPPFPSSHPSIDEVVIEEALPTPGQNIQPGLAEFYLDDELTPLNVMGDKPYTRTGGPYYVTKSSGSTLTFQFRGLPNQPIIVLSGPLNPVAATFSIIGKMDIGGAVDPITGIPTGIVVLADGQQGVGIGSLFVLDASGARELWFNLPTLPTGPYGVFQCAMLTGGANVSWVALSNTIQLDIQ